MRTSGPLTAAAAALLLLAGCGSETGESTGAGNGEGEGGTASLTSEPFCDQVDTALVGEVLQMPAEKVKTQVDREVGEEFQGFDEEAGPSTSVANLCIYGSSTSQFTVSVQPDADAGAVQETVDELAGLEGKGSAESCSSVDAESFGDPSAAFVCESGALERVRVVVTGLVGDSKFYCAAAMNTGAGPDFADAVIDACRTTMDGLAASA